MKNTSFDSAPLHKMQTKKISVSPTHYFSLQTNDNGINSLRWKYLDIAWEIITDFATELLEKDQHDEITEIMDRKRKETLAQKRSFFVRMVSDPKIYNPAINKAGSPRMSSEIYSPIAEGAPSIQTPSR